MIARQVCGAFDSGPPNLLSSVIESVHHDISTNQIGIVGSREGRWQFLALAGKSELPPVELLASSATEETLKTSSNWLVAPLSIGGRSSYLLSIHDDRPMSPARAESFQRMINSIGPVILMAIRLANTVESTWAPVEAGPDAEPPTVDRSAWIAESPAMQKLRTTVERVAQTDLPILILGENGSGKEVVSRLIHALGSRSTEPFLAVNCAALAPSLLESELFGHEAGAFTDAKETRAGKFELAADGTLFLDEIGDLNPAGQSKLLRAIEEKVVVRVGGSEPIPTNARILAATNHDLPTMVRGKRFREDLFYRLNTVLIEIPPLRERPDDILPLSRHFLTKFCRPSGRRMTLSKSAEDQLRSHNWPGNVRELRNMMERLAFLVEAEQIDAVDILQILERSPRRDDLPIPVKTLADATKEFQMGHIKQQIRAARGNMTDAAKRLGLQRSNLYRKMRQLGMSNSSHDE